MKNTLPLLIISLIWLGAGSVALTPYLLYGDAGGTTKYLCLIAVPVLFIASFVLIAGTLSLIGQKGIVKGIFPRQALHPVYFLRRVYGGCWTQLFYFKPIYSVVLLVPAVRSFAFKLFGYRGISTNFVVYPDTWIRDLPLLNFGDNVYLANRATIGTNLCLSDGNIMVDSVKIGTNSLIGHLAVIGPCIIGEKSEVGVCATMGVRVRLNNNVQISPRAGIGHGVRIDDNSVVGQQSHIGTKVMIGKNIKIPNGANIPNGSILLEQDDVNKYYSSETELLIKTKDELKSLLFDDLQDVS